MNGDLAVAGRPEARVTEADRLALAMAVASPNTPAMYLTADNAGAEWDTVERAVASARAFTVAIRDGVAVCDVDADESDGSEVWGGRAVDEVLKIGGAVVRVTSGGPESEHIWCLAPVGWTSDDLKQTLVNRADVPKSRVRIGGMRIRPPLAPHRAGGCGRLVDPPTVSEAVERLTTVPGSVALRAFWRARLRDGDTTGYNGRGGLIFAIALAFVNAGETRQSFVSDMLNPANAAGAKVREMPGDKRDRYLADIWLSAMRRVRANPPAGSAAKQAEELAAARRLVQTWPWSGRTGATDLAVFEALCDEGSRFDRPIVAISERQLAERTGRARTTVHAALCRLRKLGLIAVEAQSAGMESAEYRLLCPTPEIAVTDTSTTVSYRGTMITTGVVDPNFSEYDVPDAFRGRGGLSLGAWQTLQAVPLDAWVTTAEVALRRSGAFSRATVREHLRELNFEGFVERNGTAGHKWRRLPAGPAQLEYVAERRATAGRRDRMVAKHAAERRVEREKGYFADHAPVD